MATEVSDRKVSSDLAIICVLGAPGAGKGTLCAHLAQNYNLLHYSIGDNLRRWPLEHPNTPLAQRIQSIFKDQSPLTFEEIEALLDTALKSAADQAAPSFKGILFDGYPRYSNQVKPFDAWLAKHLHDGQDLRDSAKRRQRPDVVLFFDVTRKNALERYLSRAREPTDNEQLFEKRYSKFEEESLKVIEGYKARDNLISLDVNGTIQENLERLEMSLESSPLWQAIM